MEDLRGELLLMRSELLKLNRAVMPLTAITDLSLSSGALQLESGESVDMSQLMTPEERERLLDTVNATQVLNNLAEFINTRELPNKRVEQIRKRFTTIEKFKKFKGKVIADEERKMAQENMTKQLRQVFVKLQDFDASQLNLENDLGKFDHQVRQKANNEAVDEIRVQMETLATKNDLELLTNRLEAYTTLDAFHKVRLKHELENENLQAKTRQLVQTKRLDTELETMREHIAEVTKESAFNIKNDFAKEKRELLQKIDGLHRDLILLQEENESSRVRIIALEK